MNLMTKGALLLLLVIIHICIVTYPEEVGDLSHSGPYTLAVQWVCAATHIKYPESEVAGSSID